MNCVEKKRFFQCSTSKTCRKTDKKVLMEYDDGPARGNVAYDTIYLNTGEY